MNNYLIVNEIGSGQFGKVYRATRKSDNKVIALKVINIPEGKDYLIEITQLEIDILKTLSQPNCNPFVICYYGSHYDKQNRQFLIEMELVEGKTMQDYVDDLRANKVSKQVYYYLLLIAKDLLQGLKYTHRKNIIHNDIKPTNIMIDNNNVPRIIDYGLSCTTVNEGKYGKHCDVKGGTADFIPPEFIDDDIRLPASDLWALGITLYQSAMEGKMPYNIGQYAPIPVLFDFILSEEPNKLNTSNKQLNDLVNGLLVRDPTKRLTADQALKMLDKIEKPVFGQGEPTGALEKLDSQTGVKPPDKPRQFNTPTKPTQRVRLDRDLSSFEMIGNNNNYGFITPEPGTKPVTAMNKPPARARDTFGSIPSIKKDLILSFVYL